MLQLYVNAYAAVNTVVMRQAVTGKMESGGW